jgi:hypothetical protein
MFRDGNLLPATFYPTKVFDDLWLTDVRFDERKELRVFCCSSHLYFSMRVDNRLLPLFG